MGITLNYQQLTPADFDQVIHLATTVHGEGYIDQTSMQAWYEKGLKNNINAGFVVYHNEKLVGFRITYAAQQWQIDQWCTTQLCVQLQRQNNKVPLPVLVIYGNKAQAIAR